MLKKLLLMAFIITFVYSDSKIDTEYKFGVFIGKLDQVHQNKIKSVALRLEKEIENILNNNYNISVSFVEDGNEILDDFISFKKYNIIFIPSPLYLSEKKKMNSVSKDMYSFTYNNRFQKYILLTNKDSNINSLKDIKNKRFGNFAEAEYFSKWLDYLALKEVGISSKKLISSEKAFSKDKTLILDMYFNKIDFGVIKKSTYEDMLILNPALKDKLVILRESEAMFPYGMAFFHKKTPKKLVNVFNKFVAVGILKSQFKHLFSLLEQTSFSKISKEQLKPLENFDIEYKRMKSKL